MRASSRILSAVCLAALTATHAYTQEKVGPTQAAAALDPASRPEFAGEAAIILERRSLVSMKADGTGLRESTLALRVQTDAALRQFGVVQIPFASSAEHPEFLYVRVRHRDGSVTETPVSGAIEQPAQVTQEAPFYSDLKSLQLPVKNLGIGDTLEWRARVTRTVPEAPGQFWGQDTFVTSGIALAETFDLHIPAGTRVTVWTNPETAKPTETLVGTERVIRWTSQHLVPTSGTAADEAKKKPLTPEADLANRKGALPSFGWTTFPSWEAVGAWYRGLEAGRGKPDATIAAKVTQLTAGKTTETEKAHAVYDYVSTQIRYIGVAFGIGRYQPHTAAEVLADQYGDCKDKHTLLAAMLTQLGLQPDAVLVGAGLRFNEALPSPGSFNHLITHVTLEGKPVWLDSTAEVAPWGTLYPVIRDQPVLIVPDASPSRVVRTEATPPFPAFATVNTTETLDGDLTSTAHMALTFHDDDELLLRQALRQAAPAQYPELVQKFVGAMGFGGTTSDAEISRPTDLEQPLAISYTYKRIKEADWGQNRVTVPLWPVFLATVDEKEPPVASIELGTPRTETSTVEIKLPPGWSAELPESIHAKSAFATVDMTFHLSSETVTAERKLTILQARLPAQDWKTYRTWINEAQVSSIPYLQLVPQAVKAGETPGKTAAAPAANDGFSAEQLVAQAVDALRSMDTVRALRLLDQAKEKNPKQRHLWGQYGYAAYLQGEITKAAEDVQKEMDLYPDEIQMNGLLSTLQSSRGDHEAAAATLHRWAEAAPDDPNPVVALMVALANLHRRDEAIATGSAALQRLGAKNADLTQLRLLLANMQQQSGKKVDAAATVLPLEKTVTDLNQQNSVVYLLADAKVNLPNDESTERDLLKKLDDETANWTLDEAPDLLRSRTNLLIASWDTMGWIFFQQGRATDARAYIAAAWQNAPNAEIQGHLHAIDTSLHQGTKEDTLGDQNRRTFPLGASKGRHGTEELRLLLGDGKVLRSEPPRASQPSAAKAQKDTAPSLPDAAEVVKTADLSALFPGGSHARLVRMGMVNCSGPTCHLILEPMSTR